MSSPEVPETGTIHGTPNTQYSDPQATDNRWGGLTGLTGEVAESIVYAAERSIIPPSEEGDKTGQCRMDIINERLQYHRFRFLGFAAGVFDLHHPNHTMALVHARITTAATHLLTQGSEIKRDRMGNIAPDSRREILDLANSSDIGMIVSLDTDARVAAAKSNKDTKRPIQPWETRAFQVAYAQLPGRTSNIADIVTSHGDGYCHCGGQTCPHKDNADIAHSAGADVAVTSFYSSATHRRLKELGFDGTVLVYHESDAFFGDGKNPPPSTSGIVKRILGL